jgi:hypothetical protein
MSLVVEKTLYFFVTPRSSALQAFSLTKDSTRLQAVICSSAQEISGSISIGVNYGR